MASVHLRKGSQFYVCCYRVNNGRYKQASSGTTDRATAMAMAWKLEGLASNFSQAKAIDLIDEIARVHNERVSDPRPSRIYFEKYRATQWADWSESTRKTFHGIEKAFCSMHGDHPIGKLERGHIVQYRDHLQTQGRSRRTVKQHIKYVRRVLTAAVEAGLLAKNPCADVTVPTPRDSVKQPFSMEQFRALLNHTDGEWHELILIAGLTGQRLRDCLQLKHEDIDRDGGSIRFRRNKNQDFHRVPLHPAIKDCLTTGFGPVFPTLGTLPMTGSRSVSTRFRFDILPRIGIVQPYAENAGGNKSVTEYSFHSFRHMLSTELNRTGASPETRMMIVGHDDSKVSSGYTHATFADAVAALDRVVV